MEPLEFREIADLISLSRTTTIQAAPERSAQGKWAIHRGAHNVHTASYPFTVLYLSSKATRADIEEVHRATKGNDAIHVVYPESLDSRHRIHHSQFQNATGVWTTKEYLRSFIKDELQTYLAQVTVQKPEHYINPRVETPSGSRRREPNPIWDALIEADLGSNSEAGFFAVLLAHPGQGKTYLSKFLVARLAESKRNIIPLMVDSSQWSGMSLDDQSSIWKTITQTFRHFGAPIGWLEDHEDQFLRVALKADIFRVVFDGFDEYVLRNAGKVNALDALGSLAHLVETTGSRIVITSRTSFWETNLAGNDVASFVDNTGAYIYRLLPFDREHSRSYFERRLASESARGRANQVFNDLYAIDPELVGRGFALSLIADLFETSGYNVPGIIDKSNALNWLISALCQREVVRQVLPYSESNQMRLLRTFATEVATGQLPATDLLDLAMEAERPDLDVQTREKVIEKLKSHPLLKYDPANGMWSFEQDQVFVLFLAQCVIAASEEGRQAALAARLRLEAGAWQDLAIMAVQLVTHGVAEKEAIDSVRPGTRKVLRSKEKLGIR